MSCSPGSTTVNPGTKLVGNENIQPFADAIAARFNGVEEPAVTPLLAHAAFLSTAKRRRRGPAPRHLFIDPDGYAQAIARSERAFLAELNKQGGR